MLTVGNGDLGTVVHGGRVTLPSLLDAREDGAAGGGIGLKVRTGVAAVSAVLVEDAGVGPVEVHLVELDLAVPGADDITGFIGDELENVGADVPAAEGVEIPVRGYRRDLTVVVVVVVVCCADEIGGDGVAEEDAEDAVLPCVSLALVESD